MARIRTIQPNFAQSPSMKRIGRDARLLFVLLWTVVDDEGRCHAEPDDLASVLFPVDFDAPRYVIGWLDELEHEGCIERYDVDGIDYLRVMHWRKHQWIGHPSPSYLPVSPNERLGGSGIPEASGRLRGRRGKTKVDQEFEPRSCTFPENPGKKAEDDDSEVVVTQQSVLRDLRRIQRNAEDDRSHPSALRSVEAIARIGLASERGRSDDEQERSRGPAELMGLPDTSGAGRR